MSTASPTPSTPPQPSGAPSLEALVSALTTSQGADKAPAALVQLDPDAAALAMQPGEQLLIVLRHDPSRSSPEQLDERLGRVLRSERPDVLAGLNPEMAFAVLLGADASAIEPPAVPERSERLKRQVGWSAITPAGEVVGGHHGVHTLLVDAVAAARRHPEATVDLVSVERQGEDRVGKVGEERLFQRAAGSLRRAPATVGLGVVLLVIFVLEGAWGGVSFSPTHAQMGAMVPRKTLGGEWWRLLSAGYLHASVQHLGGNLQTLILCYFAELVLQPSRFIVLFTLAVLGGNLAALQFSDAYTMHLGASGGIFGLATALFVLTQRDHRLLPGVTAKALRAQLGFLLGLNVLLSFAPGVSMSGHLGGAVVGAALILTGALTWGLPRVWMDERPRPEVARVYRWAAAACLVATAAALGMAWTRGRPWAPLGVATRRVTFAPHPVSMELLETISAPPREATEDTPVIAGLNGDPFAVSVKVSRLSVPVQDAALARAIEELRERYQTRGAAASYIWLSPPRTLSTGGRPALYVDQDYKRKDGSVRFRAPRWLLIAGDRQIEVEVLLPPGAPKAWEEAAQRAVGSLQIDLASATPPPAAAWRAVATVSSASGPAPVQPGATCDVTLTRYDRQRTSNPCRWLVQCEKTTLYGAGTAGWAPCKSDKWPPGVKLSDPEITSKDGDPALVIDASRGVLSLRDEAPKKGEYRVEATFAPQP